VCAVCTGIKSLSIPHSLVLVLPIAITSSLTAIIPFFITLKVRCMQRLGNYYDVFTHTKVKKQPKIEKLDVQTNAFMGFLFS
jgi:hypothetical protein